MLESGRRPWCKWWRHKSGNDWWVSPRTKQSSPKKYRMSCSTTFSTKRRNGKMWLLWPSQLVRKSSTMWWIASGCGRFCHLNRLDIASSASRKFHSSHQDDPLEHHSFPKETKLSKHHLWIRKTFRDSFNLHSLTQQFNSIFNWLQSNDNYSYTHKNIMNILENQVAKGNPKWILVPLS